MSFWFDKVFAASQPGGVPVKDEEVKEFINGFTQKVILLSSARFLKAWSEFKGHYLAGGTADPNYSANVTFEFEKVLKAMRREFGQTNRGLSEGAILRLWITDIDEEVSKRKAKPRT